VPERVGAIVVAAGSGTRMQGGDKLFTVVAGRALLSHPLAAFQRSERVDAIALVLSEQNLERGRALVKDQKFTKVMELCTGGRRRQDSVLCGLESLGPCDWVIVHDGGRPLVRPDIISRGLEEARETGAAVPGIPVTDTVKEVDENGCVLRTLDRARLWSIQTPQVFRYDLLMRAHREVTDAVTDDAAMLEALGLPVKVYEGSRRNLKITTLQDLRFAEALLQS
jgi:2-C-methyl-D-erythritol 4-phosphate cytidylyltransferase